MSIVTKGFGGRQLITQGLGESAYVGEGVEDEKPVAVIRYNTAGGGMWRGTFRLPKTFAHEITGVGGIASEEAVGRPRVSVDISKSDDDEIVMMLMRAAWDREDEEALV